MPLFTPVKNPLWTPADQGLLTWNFDPVIANGSSGPLATAGTVYAQSIPVRTAISVTNIVMVLNTNGATLTSGQCFAALYTGAGGTLIGVTADQSVAWAAGATKVVTMALAGGPFTVAAGTVYAVAWFNGTTGPSFVRAGTGNALSNVGLAAAASRWGTADTGITTTGPGTLGTISGAGNAYWVALS